MPLLDILLVLLIVGVGLYLVNKYIPMAASISMILNIVVVVGALVWLLAYASDLPIGR
jgi:NADH:ubiquinone oxidoreductase subunit 5 (subunit L)/multisubunit Na+/H+ antiporter MnhA subunit